MASRLEQVRDWEGLARQSGYSAKRLAQACRVTVRHLRRHCRRMLGFKLHTWLHETRMNDAAKLLRPGRQIKAVAYRLGYKQVSHFSRAFKNHWGIRPNEHVGKVNDAAVCVAAEEFVLQRLTRTRKTGRLQNKSASAAG